MARCVKAYRKSVRIYLYRFSLSVVADKRQTRRGSRLPKVSKWSKNGGGNSKKSHFYRRKSSFVPIVRALILIRERFLLLLGFGVLLIEDIEIIDSEFRSFGVIDSVYFIYTVASFKIQFIGYRIRAFVSYNLTVT